MPFTRYFKAVQQEVNKKLEELLPPADTYPPRIHEAMRFSVFAGGKRLRPMLALCACEAAGGARASALPFACALEIIHTYTLIHDDLPALDDDDMRRGRLSSHKQFDEATAILAGDGLLTLAFEIMTNQALAPDVAPETLLSVAGETARAVGSTGTIGGQMVDIELENSESDLPALEYIHSHKTGKLISASTRGGARLCGGADDHVTALTGYGRKIGMAFQIIDDILDVEGETKTLGKTTGSDKRKNKLTYPAVSGMESSRKYAAQLVDSAIESLEMFGPAGERLKDLAEYVIARAF